MPIVSSEIVADDAQADGRRYIREHHTDDAGVVHTFGPVLAPANTNAEAVMLARVPQIEAQIAATVISAQRGDDADSGHVKEQIYLDDLSEADAIRLIGYTAAELEAVRND